MNERVITTAKLPLTVPDRIATELRQYARSTWHPHFNTRQYQGEWTVLPLRTPGGKDHAIPDLIGDDGYADTIHMRHLPSVQALMGSLACPIQSVRFLNLKAGAEIKPHRDHELAFEKGEARLHFPIITNRHVEFYIECTRLDMQPGTCWYINANLVHQVTNRGATDRIHLVVDCVVNDWLARLFDRADKQTKTAEVDIVQQRQVIDTLRSKCTPAATRLAEQLERELWKR